MIAAAALELIDSEGLDGFSFRALAKRLAAIERHLTGHDADLLRIYELLQKWPAPPEEDAVVVRDGPIHFGEEVPLDQVVQRFG